MQEVRVRAVEFLKYLSFRGGRYDLWKIAVKNLLHPDIRIRTNVLGLVTSLMYKDYLFTKEAAYSCFTSTSYDVQSTGIALYGALVDKGQFLDEALSIVERAFKSESAEVRKSAVVLLAKLATQPGSINNSLRFCHPKCLGVWFAFFAPYSRPS